MKEYTLQDAKDEIARKLNDNWTDFVTVSIESRNYRELMVYYDKAAELHTSKVTEELRKENEVMKGQLEFYRSETQKLREYLEVNRIGKPNQKLFDALYEEIGRLKESNKELFEALKNAVAIIKI